MSDMTIKGVVSLDTSNADIGLARVETNATKMAAGVKKAGTEAGKGFDGVGAGGDAASKKVDTSTRSMIASIQRLTAQMDAGEKNSSKYFEAIAKQRGISSDVLRPYLTQLDAARSRQDAAASSLRGFGGVADQARATMLSLGTAFAGMFSARAFFSAADAVTSLNNQLKLATGSAEAAKSAYDGLFDVAQRSRTGFVELGSTFASISRAADGLGLSQQQLLKLTETIGNAITVSGASASASSAALVQLSQGLASGVLRGEELNSIMEQTPRLARAIADGLGVPIGKLREMGKAGELSAQAVIAALQSQSSVLTGEVQDSVLTVGQAFTQLKNSATGLSGEIDRVTGSTSTMAGVMSAASGSLDEISRAMRGVEGSGTDLAGVVGGGIATVFETVTVLGSNVAYTIKQIGNELGGLAAQAVAVAKLDFSAAGEIGRMMREDSAKARQEIDALTDRVLSARSVSDRIRSSLSGVDTRAEDARLARTGASGVRSIPVTPASKKPAGSRSREGDQFAAEREAAKGWADAFGDFSKLALEAEGKALGLTRAQQRLVEFLGSPAYMNSSEPMKELALQQAYVAIAAEQAADALKKEQAAIEAAVNAMAGLVEKQQGGAASIQEQVRQQKEATAAYGLSGEALLELETARLLDTAAERERQAVIADGIDLSGMLGQAYRDEAIALRELAAAKKNDATVRQQTDQYRSMWQGIEGFAENAFMDVALNGEDAFKRIGESIKREVIQLLYEMTVKKWIFQISGVGGGGGTAGSIIDYASSAYSAYSTAAGGGAGAAGAVGGSASAVGSYVGGSMSAANAYGSIYANTTGTGINGLLATNGAYGTAGAGGVAGSTSASMVSYFGYAAMIAAAVMVAENLYAKGYNRAALGKGPGESNAVGNTTFQADSRFGSSNIYNGSPENVNRQLGDAIGLNKKWVDMLSGTTRMATLFGRKLGAYGFTADIAGGDADVGGFTRYKGGVFRSNKTVKTEIDPRDAAAFDAIVESQIEGSKAMARAMGYSDEAINAYTGSLKVNFKGAKTAEEQAERVATAMDDLNYELLKTASGGKLARDEFKQFMEGIQKDIEAAGISTQGLTDILSNGIVNGLSGEEIGAQLTENIMGGIYATMAQNAFAPVAAALMQQIITPMFTAMASGIPLAQALNKAALNNVVQMANDAAAMLNEIFNNEEFRAAMASLGSALSSVGGAAASVHMPPIRSVKPVNTAADTAKREKEQLERELLTLQGNTVEIRRRERAALQASNRALYDRVKALEDEQAIMEERKDLERQLMEIRGETAKIQALEREALNEANRGLYDEVINAQRLADLKEAWKGLTDSIEEEVKRIRGEMLADTPDGLNYLKAQFAIDTAAARAGDQEAAARLPDISSSLIEAGEAQSATLSDFQFLQGSIAASLEETNRIARLANGVTVAAVEDKALAAQVASLQASVNTNTAEVVRLTGIFAKVTNGPALRTVVIT